MPVAFDMTGDFSLVVDTLEPITLARRRGERIAISKAWRFAASTSEASPSSGVVTATDTTWQFEWPPGEPFPRVGDHVIDSTNERGTIQSVEHPSGKTRLKVLARNLAIACGLDQQVTIQEAEWEGTPAEIVAWRTIDTAVPAHIQPDPLVADLEAAPPTHTQDFRITIDTSLALDGNHRLLTAEGRTYRVREVHDAARIDRLPVAVCVSG